MAENKIVAATATAFTIGEGRSREMENAMAAAVTAALARGVVDPKIILDHKMSARKALKEKWQKADAAASARAKAAAEKSIKA